MTVHVRGRRGDGRTACCKRTMAEMPPALAPHQTCELVDDATCAWASFAPRHAAQVERERIAGETARARHPWAWQLGIEWLGLLLLWEGIR